MRPEKQFLVEEVGTYLDKSDYVFLTNFDRLSVAETEDLRTELNKFEAEFHVVKNSILNVAAKRREIELDDFLNGPTAIVVGGQDAPGIAKFLLKYHKDKEKLAPKGGALGTSSFPADQLKAVSELPPLDQARAELLGVLQTPAQLMVNLFLIPGQDMVNLFAAVPRELLNVFSAYEHKQKSEEGAA